MNEEKMREEFEVWVKTKGRNTLRSTVYGFDYQSNMTEEYWRVWQAACASKQKEIDSWKIVAEDWRVKAVEWSRKNAMEVSK